MVTILEAKLMTLYKKDMIKWLRSHPEHLEEALDLAISDKQPLAKRAAFILWSYIKKNDPLIFLRSKQIIDSFHSKSDDHKRELIKVLLLIELDREEEAILFDISVKLWERIDNKPSIRMTALKMMLKIAGKYTDLIKEISVLTDETYLETFSAKAKISVTKALNKLI